VWERYLDARCLYVDENGRVSTRKEMVENIRPLAAGVSGSIRIVEFDAVVHGDVAVVSHLDDEHENYHGHALHCQYRTTDTWKKTPAGWRLVGAQVLALPTDPPSVPIPEALRNEYRGRYSLAPDITYEIRAKGESLEGQQSGRKAENLKAEAPDILFVPGKARYRKIILRGPDGRITGFAERREAWDLVWTREQPDGLAPGEPSDVRRAAVAFYEVYLEAKPTGVPKVEDLSTYENVVSPGLLELLDEAGVAEENYARMTDGDSPPLEEGDLFSSLFEGASEYRIESCEAKEESGSCSVALTSIDPRDGSSHEWRDRILLAKDARGWRVDDVEYGGTWEFMHKGHLRVVLEGVIRDSKNP
jgi:hypothetical protein